MKKFLSTFCVLCLFLTSLAYFNVTAASMAETKPTATAQADGGIDMNNYELIAEIEMRDNKIKDTLNLIGYLAIGIGCVGFLTVIAWSIPKRKNSNHNIESISDIKKNASSNNTSPNYVKKRTAQQVISQRKTKIDFNDDDTYNEYAKQKKNAKASNLPKEEKNLDETMQIPDKFISKTDKPKNQLDETMQIPTTSSNENKSSKVYDTQEILKEFLQ